MKKECCNANSFAPVKSDYNRLDRVPTATYKQMLKLHDEYVTVRETIEQQQGLISPIKALVFRDLRTLHGRKHFIQHLIEVITSIEFKRPTNKFEEQRISVDPIDTMFMNHAKIVGYCVAIPDANYPEAPFKVGISYCRPDDYEHFNREFGILQAYKHATEWNSCTDVNPYGPDKKMVSTNRCKDIIYVWANSYNKQIEDFYNRVEKYFKPITNKENE